MLVVNGMLSSLSVWAAVWTGMSFSHHMGVSWVQGVCRPHGKVIMQVVQDLRSAQPCLLSLGHH